MSFVNALEPTLNEILLVIKPLREDWESRWQVINELQNVVQSVESLRGATVGPFGSFVSNLFTRCGDLDISIDLTHLSCVSSAAKKRKRSLLSELHKALRQKGGCNRLQLIPNARVPILKIESNIQRISCDISIDNLEGQLKSKILFWINDIDGRFRDMVLLVKEWAKANDINNPKTGTFNSYSLTLLVIFHFQTCVPAILPPLKDIYPRNAVDDLVGGRASAEESIANICAANIARLKSDNSRFVNRSSLSQLFVSFLAKFSDIHVKAQELGVCPYTGKWEAINSNTRWFPRTYSIFIEDPFEQPENAARSVSSKKLIEISQAFEMSRRSLISENRTQSSIRATLMRPRRSRFLARRTAGSLGYNGSHNGSRKVPGLSCGPEAPGHNESRKAPDHNESWKAPDHNESRKAPDHNGGLKIKPQWLTTHVATQSHHQFLNTRPMGPQMQRQFRNVPSEMRSVWQDVIHKNSQSQTRHSHQKAGPEARGGNSIVQAVWRRQSPRQVVWRPKHER